MINTINDCLLNANDYQFMYSTLRINDAITMTTELSEDMSFAVIMCVLISIFCVLMLILTEMLKKRGEATNKAVYGVVGFILCGMAAWWGGMYYEQVDHDKVIAANALIIQELQEPSLEIFNACKGGNGVLSQYDDNNNPVTKSTYKEMIDVPTRLTKKPLIN